MVRAFNGMNNPCFSERVTAKSTEKLSELQPRAASLFASVGEFVYFDCVNERATLSSDVHYL
jgi:hypothetical protein